MYGFSWAAQQCKLIETGPDTLDAKQNQTQELRMHLMEVAVIEENLDNAHSVKS